MKTLLKNARVVNVFTETIEETNVLIEKDKIIGVGDYYTDGDADVIVELLFPCVRIAGKIVGSEVFAKLTNVAQVGTKSIVGRFFNIDQIIIESIIIVIVIQYNTLLSLSLGCQ